MNMVWSNCEHSVSSGSAGSSFQSRYNEKSDRARYNSSCSIDGSNGPLHQRDSISVSIKNDDVSRSSFRGSFHAPRELSIRRGSHDDLTMDKLRYRTVGVYGRETEQAILNRALDAVQNSSEVNEVRELVLISGKAGTGKTTLASTLKSRVESANGFFLRGKFDLFQRGEPYSGIASACRELCDGLTRLRDDPIGRSKFEAIRNDLSENLGDELSFLSNVIPALNRVMLYSSLEGLVHEVKIDVDNHELDKSKNRLHYAFRRFIRLLSFHFLPLVLVLDDLQWADSNSLDLMEALLTDSKETSILVIGCYRDDEVHAHHPFRSLIDKLNAKKDRCRLRISEMTLGNLDVTGAHRMLMDLLGTDEPCTMDLASVCHRKTVGNPFFLISYVTLLYEEKLLRFNLATLKWNWDSADIDAKTFATDNVVEVIQRKISALPSSQRLILVLASFLGASFEKQTLQLLWEGCGNDFQGTSDFDSLLEASVEDGIMNELEGGRYRFVHDKICEGAQSLVEEHDLPSMQLRMGTILLESVDGQEFENDLFIGLNLMNSGPVPSDPLERTRLAELNLKAARKAMEMSGFETAVTYIDKCCAVLPENKWTANYALALEVHSTAAELYALLGNLEHMDRQCNEVLAHAGSVDDKLRIHLIRLESLIIQTRLDDGIKLGLDVLKKINIHFPKNSVQRTACTVIGLVRRRNAAKRMTDESIHTITAVTDPREQLILKLLAKLYRLVYFGRNNLLPLIALKTLEITTKIGITEFAPRCYALVGVLFSGVMFDLHTGTKYAEYALKLSEKFDYRRTISATTSVSYGLVVHWTRPVRSVLKPLVRGYEIGLQVGDTEHAMWCILFYLVISFYTGRTLELLDADARVYANQMEELNRLDCLLFFKIRWQEWQNYIGLSDDVLTLTGDVMNEDEILEFAQKTNVSGVRCALLYSKQALAVFFGEHERGAKLALDRPNDVASEFPATYEVSMDPFYRSLNLYAMARRMKKRRYIKPARRYRQDLKVFIKKGNINLFALNSMLDAEEAALKGDDMAATRHWMAAIVFSRGMLHYTALANERYGEFLLHDVGDPHEASFRLEQAVQNYQEWGSVAKVDQLLAKYGNLLKVTPITNSSTFPSVVLALNGDN